MADDTGTETTQQGAEQGEDRGGEQQQTTSVFTQQQVDNIVRERVGRELARYADYDDLKAKAEQFDAVTGERDEYKTEAEKAREQLAKTDVRLAVFAEATRVGAVDPEDVLRLLPDEAVKLDDQGRVVGAQKAVAELVKAKPHLFRQRPAGDGGARDVAPPSNGHSDMDALIRRAFVGG